MNKEELLQELAVKIGAGEISRSELVSRLNLASPTKQEGVEETGKLSHFSITKMLYVLGAAIVIIGVIIFITQIWGDIGSFGRILVTLGLGLLCAAIGSVLLKQKPEDNIGSIFHCFGGVLIPMGALVTLAEFNVLDITSRWPITITFAVIFGFYLLLTLTHKHVVLTLFAIANGTGFIYLLVGAIVGGSYDGSDNLYAYLTMIIGVSYLALAHAFRGGWNKELVRFLYFFGITGFLGAAFSQVFGSVLWQLLYFLFVFGGLFLSVYVRSRIVLIISTLFLVAHVSFITSEYFANSIGWPISLVILGFVFIGLGYASITINKKYIKPLPVSES